MKFRSFFILAALISLSLAQLGMARGVYDEEARAAEKQEKELRRQQKKSKNPAAEFASGVREATVDSTASLLSETAEGTRETPLIGTVEGASAGSGKAVDHAVKGAVKVATLGFGEVDKVSVEDPEDNSGDTTKFSIALPGT